MQPVPVEPQASPPESAKRPTEKAAAEEKPSEDFPAKTVPLPKDPTKRGDLIVSFDVLFPDQLSQSSKDIIYDVLS